MPEPIHISALAKAGTERSPLTSAAMFFSATIVIHGAPNAIAITTRMTLATTHEDRVSTDARGSTGKNVDCSMVFALLARPAGLLSLVYRIAAGRSRHP